MAVLIPHIIRTVLIPHIIRMYRHIISSSSHALPSQQENVQMMSEYMPLSKFKSVYVVDLCKALCEVAQAKVCVCVCVCVCCHTYENPSLGHTTPFPCGI